MADPIPLEDFDRAVATFKQAWHDADNLGQGGHRVEWGIHALINIGWRPQLINAPNRSDIVTWLRAFTGPGSIGANEAADEIERLRALSTDHADGSRDA